MEIASPAESAFSLRKVAYELVAQIRTFRWSTCKGPPLPLLIQALGPGVRRLRRDDL